MDPGFRRDDEMRAVKQLALTFPFAGAMGPFPLPRAGEEGEE